MKINYMNILLGFLLILGMCVIIGGTKETFIAHGKFPLSVDNPMMEDSLYPYKNPRGLSDASYRSQWLSYPVWSVGNYEQKTNNVRYWRSPCNGTSAPADMCGGLYEKIEQRKICIPAPPKKFCKPRVNYYCA